MIDLDNCPPSGTETELDRLRQALQAERERRVMAALWGSRDDQCPQPFSVYDHDRGVVAYGVEFHDGIVITRTLDGPGPAYVTATADEAAQRHRRDEDEDETVTVVWLAEDIDDLTTAITEDVRDRFRDRAKSDAVRVAVAEAISRADPVDSTWQDCLSLADAALSALFAEDEPDDEDGRAAWTLASP